MTFTELQTQFRREVIGDRSSDVWKDEEILSMLANASVEIAAMLGFPQATATESLSAGDSSIPAPSDLLNVQIQQVSIGDWDLNPGRMIEVLRRRNGSGPPDTYTYDPRKGGAIEFAPALTEAADATIEYTKEIDASNIVAGDSAWEGRFPEWHWLIPLRAGVGAWRSVQDFERAQYFQQEYQTGFTHFAAYLGVPNPLAPSEGQQQQRADSAGVN